MKVCDHQNKKDLTQGLGEHRHYYCTICGWHLYKDVEYTKEQTSYNLFSFNSDSTKIFLQVLFSCAIFLIVFGGIGFAYSKITGNPIKMPTLGKLKTA